MHQWSVLAYFTSTAPSSAHRLLTSCACCCCCLAGKPTRKLLQATNGNNVANVTTPATDAATPGQLPTLAGPAGNALNSPPAPAGNVVIPPSPAGNAATAASPTGNTASPVLRQPFTAQAVPANVLTNPTAVTSPPTATNNGNGRNSNNPANQASPSPPPAVTLPSPAATQRPAPLLPQHQWQQ